MDARRKLSQGTTIHFKTNPGTHSKFRFKWPTQPYSSPLTKQDPFHNSRNIIIKPFKMKGHINIWEASSENTKLKLSHSHRKLHQESIFLPLQSGYRQALSSNTLLTGFKSCPTIALFSTRAGLLLSGWIHESRVRSEYTIKAIKKDKCMVYKYYLLQTNYGHGNLHASALHLLLLYNKYSTIPDNIVNLTEIWNRIHMTT